MNGLKATLFQGFTNVPSNQEEDAVTFSHVENTITIGFKERFYKSQGNELAASTTLG